MKKIVAALLLLAGPAFGQSAPHWVQHYQVPQVEWDVWWGKKQDYNGDVSGQHVTANSSTKTLEQWLAIPNTTSAAGYQQNGNTILTVGPFSTPQGSNTAAMFVGPGAGAAFPIATPDTYGIIGFGTNSLQAFTAIGSETMCGGTWSCQALVSGGLNTVWGMHALGAATNTTGVTAFGNDAFRDSFPTGYDIAIGQHAAAHGAPQGGTIWIGSQNGRGNSSAVLLTGTVTTGDTETITLSASGSTPAGLTGLPATYTHTNVGGDTLASIATDLANHLSQAINGPSYFNGAVTQNYADGAAVVSFQFPGTSTLGWAITVTASQTGSASEVMTVTGGSKPSHSISIGNNGALGEGLVAMDYLTSAGDANAPFLRGSPAYVSLWGGNAGHNLITPIGVNFSGRSVGGTCQNPADVVLISSGNPVAAVDCPTINQQHWLNVANTVMAATSAPTVQSGFGTSPSVTAGTSSAAFLVNVGTGGSASTGIMNLTQSAPHGYICSAVDQTNPATMNTVAVGSGTQFVNLANYSRTTGAAIAWTAGDVIAVSCNGY